MLVLFLFTVSAQQLTPIPSPKDGFMLGPSGSNYTLDVFYDHLCIDSANDYPGLMQYWQANQGWLGMNIHIFPLPYHSFSFVVAQAGRYIQTNYPSKFLDYMTYMFGHLNIILTNSKNWDFTTLNNKIAQYTQQATGVSYTEVLNALYDDDYNWSSRVSWKYATSRLIFGTPQYLLNGVFVPDASEFSTAAQWASFFQGLNQV